jgi:predicted RNA-binding protein with RPS1 domain
LTKKIYIKPQARVPQEQPTEKDAKTIFEESGYRDYTIPFFNVLHIDESEVWQGNTDSNRIKTKPLIIMGSTGVGKTTLAENIINAVEKDYAHRGVCSVYTNDVSLGELMEYGLQTFKYIGDRWQDGLPKVYVLVFDDATAVEVTSEEIRKFFSIRHEIQKYSGITEGIVYSIYITHDWYSLNKLFRRYCVAAAILSVPPLDKCSRSQIEGLIGKEAVAILDKVSYKAMDYDAYKGYGFVKLPMPPDGESKAVGFIHFSQTQAEYVQIKYGENQTAKGNSVERVLHIPETRKKVEIKKELESAERARDKNRERQQRFRQKKMQWTET